MPLDRWAEPKLPRCCSDVALRLRLPHAPAVSGQACSASHHRAGPSKVAAIHPCWRGWLPAEVAASEFRQAQAAQQTPSATGAGQGSGNSRARGTPAEKMEALPEGFFSLAGGCMLAGLRRCRCQFQAGQACPGYVVGSPGDENFPAPSTQPVLPPLPCVKVGGYNWWSDGQVDGACAQYQALTSGRDWALFVRGRMGR